MEGDFESARQKYKPRIIRFLLVAEAPPKLRSKRFFYFEDVRKGDGLFLETMKVLYRKDYSVTKEVRSQKCKFLEMFKKGGFYLIDASDEPMEDTRPSKKKKQIKESLPCLVMKVKSLISEGTKIILISSTVFKVCYDALKSRGFNVMNECAIPLPIAGWQKEFRQKLSTLLRIYD